jgi:hypothetical protein
MIFQQKDFGDATRPDRLKTLLGAGYGVTAALLGLLFGSGAAATQNPATWPSPPPLVSRDSNSSGWLRQLRFSQDGRYVLAQTGSEVTVLTVQPFAIVFSVPVQQATLAQFTSDSAEIIFASSIPKPTSDESGPKSIPAYVERWSIGSKARVASFEIQLKGCATVALSPDGQVVSCADIDGTLRIIDVVSGLVLFERKKFARTVYEGTPTEPCYEDSKLRGSRGALKDSGVGMFKPTCDLADLGGAMIGFSPDSHFVIAEPAAGGPSVALDLRLRVPVPMTGALKALLKSSDRFDLEGYYGSQTTRVLYIIPFVFVADDRVLLEPDLALLSYPDPSAGGADWKDRRETAQVVSFPSGRVLSKQKLSRGQQFVRAADQAFVLSSPFLGYLLSDGSNSKVHIRGNAVAISGSETISSQSALDILGRYYVEEVAIGEVGLFERGKGGQSPLTTVSLRVK